MSIIKDLFNFDQVSDSIIGGKDTSEHDKSLKLGNHAFLFVIKELRNGNFLGYSFYLGKTDIMQSVRMMTCSLGLRH